MGKVEDLPLKLDLCPKHEDTRGASSFAPGIRHQNVDLCTKCKCFI